MRAERLAELEGLRETVHAPLSPTAPRDSFNASVLARTRYYAALDAAAPELLALARAVLEWREADAAWHAAPVETLELLERLEAAEARLRGAVGENG